MRLQIIINWKARGAMCVPWAGDLLGRRLCRAALALTGGDVLPAMAAVAERERASPLPGAAGAGAGGGAAHWWGQARPAVCRAQGDAPRGIPYVDVPWTTTPIRSIPSARCRPRYSLCWARRLPSEYLHAVFGGLHSAPMNAEWHKGCCLRRSATQEESVAWHAAHQKACACREVPSSIAARLKKRGARTRT